MNIGIIILARKGSKRIPGKNTKAFNGIPLIEYTLKTAEQLGYDTYINTDCPLIKELAFSKYNNFKVFHKEEKFAQDKHATMKELMDIRTKTKDHDYYILLQPTSPIRNVNVIKGWIETFRNSDKKSGFAAYKTTKYIYMNDYPVNFSYWQRDSNPCPKKPVNIETGSFYIFHRSIIDTKHVIDYQSMMIFNDETLIDLDTTEQWGLAEHIQQNNLKRYI